MHFRMGVHGRLFYTPWRNSGVISQRVEEREREKEQESWRRRLFVAICLPALSLLFSKPISFSFYPRKVVAKVYSTLLT